MAGGAAWRRRARWPVGRVAGSPGAARLGAAWSGAAATRPSPRCRRLRRRLALFRLLCWQADQALSEFAAALDRARRLLTRAIDAAHRVGLTIDDSGTVRQGAAAGPGTTIGGHPPGHDHSAIAADLAAAVAVAARADLAAAGRLGELGDASRIRVDAADPAPAGPACAAAPAAVAPLVGRPHPGAAAVAAGRRAGRARPRSTASRPPTATRPTGCCSTTGGPSSTEPWPRPPAASGAGCASCGAGSTRWPTGWPTRTGRGPTCCGSDLAGGGPGGGGPRRPGPGRQRAHPRAGHDRRPGLARRRADPGRAGRRRAPPSWARPRRPARCCGWTTTRRTSSTRRPAPARPRPARPRCAASRRGCGPRHDGPARPADRARPQLRLAGRRHGRGRRPASPPTSVVFVGSPGVGVDSARRLHVAGRPGVVVDLAQRRHPVRGGRPGERWPADLAVSAALPVGGPCWPSGGRSDDLWFGHNPSDPAFGARIFASAAGRRATSATGTAAARRWTPSPRSRWAPPMTPAAIMRHAR